MLKIAFRIDISSEIGTGHLIRMSALADAFAERGHTYEIFKGEDEPIDYSGFDIIILDSYLLSNEYIANLNSPTKTLVCYDDNALYTYNCDIILNANLYAKELEFKFLGKTPKMLLGGKYALLRGEFRNSHVITISEKANRVFVCFGGSDTRNMTPRVIKALQDIPGVELSVVLGGYTSNDDDVYATKKSNVSVYKTPKSMVEIIRGCDIAVTSSGSMTYELAALGIPTISIAQAENQFPISEYMSRHNLSKAIGNWQNVDFENLKNETIVLLSDYERRKDESKRLSETVDKNGALNAADTILSIAGGS